jgi:hypothetical protein
MKRYGWILSIYLELYGQDSLEMVESVKASSWLKKSSGILTSWTKHPETQCL